MQNIFIIIYSIFFWAYTTIAFFISATIVFLLSIFQKNRKNFFHVASQIWSRQLILPVSGVKVEVVGIKNIPKKVAVIFASNHQSLMDIVLLLAYIPGIFHFVAKKELFNIPFLGWYISWSGHLKIDRKDFVSASKTLGNVEAALKKGDSIIVFPEGTRSKTGKLGEFKRGGLAVALKTGTPVVPIAIKGSIDITPKGTLLVRPVKVKISIGKPIFFSKNEESTREEQIRAAEKVRNAVALMLE